MNYSKFSRFYKKIIAKTKKNTRKKNWMDEYSSVITLQWNVLMIEADILLAMSMLLEKESNIEVIEFKFENLH